MRLCEIVSRRRNHHKPVVGIYPLPLRGSILPRLYGAICLLPVIPSPDSQQSLATSASRPVGRIQQPRLALGKYRASQHSPYILPEFHKLWFPCGSQRQQGFAKPVLAESDIRCLRSHRRTDPTISHTPSISNLDKEILRNFGGDIPSKPRPLRSPVLALTA